MITRWSARSTAIPAIVLTIVCLGLFGNTLTNEFVWDDIRAITQNRQIRQIRNIPDFFNPVSWNESHPDRGRYRPVRAVSLAIDYFFWGLNPAGYHLTNILLHAANVVLIYYLLLMIGGRPDDTGDNWPARAGLPFLTALFFAAHPIHTESINLVKNRSDLLALLFFLLSFLLFVGHLGVAGRIRRGLLLFGAWACFIPAALSKEMALPLPAALALYAICFLRGPERKKALVRIVPYGGIILLCLWFSQAFINPGGRVVPGVPVPADMAQRALTVILTTGCYIRMLAAPFPLNLDHPFTIPASLLAKDVRLSLSLLVMTGLLALWSSRRDRIVFFAVGWMGLTLLPAANIIYLASRPIAEQRLYIPSFGFCLLLGYAIQRLSLLKTPRLSRKRAVMISGLSAAVIVCLYVAITVGRNVDWRDELTLYSRTLAENPASYRMYSNLGNALCRKKKYDEAIRGYQTALALKPDYLEAHYNLGITLYELGRCDAAIAQYRTVLNLEPDNVDALNNLGLALYDSDRREEALTCYRRALAIVPDDMQTNWNIGDVLVDMGRPEEAIGHYVTALRLRPDCLGVYLGLGRALTARGEVDQAIGVYQKALSYDPNLIEACYGLGAALMAGHHYQAALPLFSRVLEINPDHALARRDQALCLEKMGKQ